MGRGASSEVGWTMPKASLRRREITVEAAVREDIPELSRLKQTVARRAYSASHDPRPVEAWIAKNCGEDHFRYRIGRSGYTVLVARSGGSIVGVATMRKRGDRADMSGLYVLEPGKGIGTGLVERRDEIAEDLGCSRVRASVFRTNEDGTRFVTKRGLAKAGGYRETTLGVMVDHYEGALV
jgi:L-amino acid N-acyltransferase YncA